MMKALVLTSNSLRHSYFAQAVANYFDVPMVLTEAKKNYYSTQRDQSVKIRDHFVRIAEEEEKWFDRRQYANELKTQNVPDINAPEVIKWANGEAFDVICLFGTAILGQDWLRAFPGKIVNLHLGLSPFYRGSATLFWPFAHGELHFLGTTIHLATARVDAGDILARIAPNLRTDEDYYCITTRLIRDSIDRFPEVVKNYLSGALIATPQEGISGRLCRKADFSEMALERALNYVGRGFSEDQIVAICEARPCRYFL